MTSRLARLVRFTVVGLLVGLGAARASASSSLATLEARTEAVADAHWGGSDVRNARLMTRSGPARIRKLTVDLQAYASAHPDPESVSAITFLIASARFEFADLLEAAPTPKELVADPVMAAEYRRQVAGFASPLRVQGRRYLADLLERARAARLDSPWVARAAGLLAANPAPGATKPPADVGKPGGAPSSLP